VDGSELSQTALDFAFHEASLHSCGLTAVHAWLMRGSVPAEVWGELLPPVNNEVEEKRLLLSEALAGWREKYPDVGVIEKVLVGLPAWTLIEESKHARLVVVGSRGKGGFAGLRLGSTSQALVHHADCAVAIVR
jgi:nucleotide-binding universal stress UspA family protein